MPRLPSKCPFSYATRERLYDEDVAEFSTEEQREEIGGELSEVGDWLYEDEVRIWAFVHSLFDTWNDCICRPTQLLQLSFERNCEPSETW